MPSLEELCTIEPGTLLKSSDIIPGNYSVIRFGKKLVIYVIIDLIKT